MDTQTERLQKIGADLLYKLDAIRVVQPAVKEPQSTVSTQGPHPSFIHRLLHACSQTPVRENTDISMRPDSLELTARLSP